MISREQAARDIRIVSGSPEGERLIGYLLEFCHVFRDSMGVDCNPNRTLFNEGQRSVGNELVALMVNEPERFKVESIRRIARQATGESE